MRELRCSTSSAATRCSGATSIDILLVAFIVYRCCVLIRGTRGVQMALGILRAGVLYWASKRCDLDDRQLAARAPSCPTWSSAIIVVFQGEIRRCWLDLGRTPFLGTLRGARPEDVAATRSCWPPTTLSKQRIGALLVIEREMGLRSYVETRHRPRRAC